MATQRIRGISIEITADNREFINSFKNINSAVKETAGQLRDVEKLLKLDPGNVELLTQKQTYLNKSIEDVNKRLELEQQELQRLKEADQTPEIAKEQEALQRQIQSDQIELQNLQKELKNFGDVGKQQALAVADSFKSAGEKISAVGDKIKGTGKTLSRNVTVPIVAAGTAAVKTAADFDSSMSKVQAVSGATGKEMQELRDTALDYASKTAFTATETSEALYYMGLAGWKSEQMIDGLPAVLNLAAASGEDLGLVSDIVTDALTAFGLKAEDAAHFTDVLAAASSNSNTTVAGLGEAFSYVAPVAGALGYSIEDVSLALGVMANNGIKGSQAGASLRNILSRLSKPTKEVYNAMDTLGISMTDSNGNMLSMAELLDELRGAFGKSEMPLDQFNQAVEELDSQLEEGTLSQEEYDEALENLAISAYGVEGAEKAKLAAMLGGQRSMATILSLVNTTAEDYDKLSGAIDGSAGAAQNMADTMLDNLGGQMTILKSQIEGVAIQIGDILVPIISKVVGKIQEWVTAFSELDEGTKETIVQVAAIVAAVGPALIIMGSVVSSIGSITSGIGSLIGLVATHPILGAIVLATAAIGAMTGAIALAGTEVDETWGTLYTLSDAAIDLAEKTREVAAAYDEAREARERRNEEINSTYDTYMDEWQRLEDITDATGKVKEGYEEEAEYIVGKLNEALGLNIGLKDGQIERYQQLKRSVEDLIRTKQAEALLSANEEDYLNALEERKKITLQISEAYAENSERLQEIKELERQKAEIEEEAARQGINLQQSESGLAMQYSAVSTKLGHLNNQYESTEANIKDLNKTYGKYSSTIKNHDQLVEAVEDGTIDMSEAILAFSNDLLRAGEATDESLREQYDFYVSTLDDMILASKEKGSMITKSQVDEMARMVLLSGNELSKAGLVFDKAGTEAAQAYIDSIAEKEPAVRNTTRKVAEEGLRGARERTPAYGTAGQEAAASYDQGLVDKPNRTRENGKTRATQGKEGAESVDYKSTGQNKGKQFDEGMLSDIESTKTSGRKRAESGKEGAAGVDFKGTGQSAGKQYNEGMLSDIEGTKRAARKLPEAAKSAMDEYSAYTQGQNLVEGFARGIRANKQIAAQAANEMTRNALREVNYVLDAHSPSRLLERTSGKWFDEGFARGIERNAKVVEEAAAAMTLGAVGVTEGLGTLSGGWNMAGYSALQNAGGTSNTSNTYGDINITVNGAEGQDINALADIIEDRMYRAVSRRQAIFA